jgi:hypothetical protein
MWDLLCMKEGYEWKRCRVSKLIDSSLKFDVVVAASIPGPCYECGLSVYKCLTRFEEFPSGLSAISDRPTIHGGAVKLASSCRLLFS